MFGLLGIVNCDKVKIWGRLTEGEVFLVRPLCRLSQYQLCCEESSTVIKSYSLQELKRKRRIPSQREMHACFQAGRERAENSSSILVSQVP